MPCNSYQGNDEELDRKYEGKHEALANMLCRLCKLCQTYDIEYFGLPEDIQKWFDDHKKWDEERKKC